MVTANSRARRVHLLLAFVLGVALWQPTDASAQDSQTLILRPKVIPPAIPEVQATCAECQPHADDYNRIARRINELNQELAFRRREVDLQQQAVDLVASELASLQGQPASAQRDARMKFARERLEAYRAQLAREQALVAQLEQEIAQLTGQLAAARARLQACEAACVSTVQEPPPPPPPPEPPPAEPPPPQEVPADVRLDLRALRDELTLSEEELEQRRRESEQFEASLKSMAGDQWAAEFAAFFTSTLFDPETPFKTAYLQNLKTIRQIADEKTPEQLAAQSALALQNVTVAAQRAVQQRAAVKAAGQRLEYAYTREARGLLGPSYADDQSPGETNKTAALMAQDAHMGQLLQFRAGLNTIRIGDGTVSEGSFVNLGGAEIFTRLSQINREIGTLRANGGDTDRIAALEAERAQLLKIDGVAPSDGLMAARWGLIEGLAGLSPKVYETYWTWIGWKESGGIPEKYWHLPPDQGYARWEADLAEFENAYLSALGQSPFLGAMVDPTGSGDPVPLWQYLTSTTAPWSTESFKNSQRREWYMSDAVFAPRSQALDQVALTQAIDFLDTASAQVIDQFGTIVTTVPLLDAYGSPVFGPLRAQVITDLTGIYPQITANMGVLTSQYDQNFAATALSRTVTDVAIGFAQITIGGVIFFFPVTAPVLVPVEIMLTAGQVGLEGFRTYYAWQDLQRAESAASAGAGASRVGAKAYEDLFDAQLGTFIVSAAFAPLSVGGSVMSLNAAKAQLRAAGAAADVPVATPTTATAGSAMTVVPDFPTFRAMKPGEQVAALKGLPETTRGQLVSQLNRAESKAFALAWEIESESAQILASVREGKMWVEFLDGRWQPVSEATRNAPDHVLLDRLAPGPDFRKRIRLSDDAKKRLYDEEIGSDDVGPFSTVTPMSRHEEYGAGTFAKPGSYTGQMSQAEIDALLAKTSPLTPEEIVLKTDLLLQGKGWTFFEDPKYTKAEIDAIFGKTDLTPEEAAIKADMMSRGHGQPPKLMPGWTAPVEPPPIPFNPFPPSWVRGEFDSKLGTQGGAGDSSMSGATEAIPGRPRNPNRTTLFDDPDLPPETLIFDPFFPPAAGLIDLPFDLRRLLQGDALPINIWRTGQPNALRQRGPNEFELVPQRAAADPVVTAPSLGTIVHLVPTPGTAGTIGTPPAWVPFVIKTFPIGCRFLAGNEASCDSPTYVFVLNFPPGSAGAIGEVLPATPGYVFAEGDELRRVQASDPYFDSRGSWGQAYDDQWALKQVGLHAPAAATGAASRNRVTVAVIDTGVAWNHRDLSPDSLWVNPGEKPANGRDDDGNGYVDDIVGWNFIDRNNLPWDFNGHGTLVAGIIAAGRDNDVGIAGVNPGARLMVLKAMDERGRGPASAIAEAIVYAASHGARVINLSVGGRQLTRTEYLAVEFAWSRGAIVVVAAGNEGVELTNYGPGGLPRAVTVTATDTADRRVTESNFGEDIDLAAPGVDVLGPRAIGTDLLAAARARNYRRGDNVVGPDAGYIRATGTSFAAPLVAGAASLLIAANPSLSAVQVERMLLHSARDIEAPGVDQLTGYGRLDVPAALAADPDFFVDASIARVEVAQGAKGPIARVIGSADADRFAGAKLEIGAGERPSVWKAVEGGPAKPLHDGVLAEIPAAAFGGSAVWTVRVIASHANGRKREARYLLRLN